MTMTAEKVGQQLTTRAVHPTFGLEIRGLDLSVPLDAATVAMLKELSARHKVLVFKDQALENVQLSAFAAQFGRIDQIPPSVSGNSSGSKREHDVGRLGSSDEEGNEPAVPTGYGAAAQFWHTDSSWRPIPTWLTILSAGELPAEGGQTAFADMGAAYEALSDERKALLEGKQMVHSWRIMRRYLPSIPELGDEAPTPVTHPLVRTIDGRKSLFLNGHVSYYVGNMAQADGEALFDELMAHATGPEFVYEHEWSDGDVVMWDDRTTMHRVLPYDYSKRRVLYRAEVLGTEAP